MASGEDQKAKRNLDMGLCWCGRLKQHIDWLMCRGRGVGPKKGRVRVRVMACVGARSRSTYRTVMRRERFMGDLKWKRNNVYGGLGKLWKE